MFINKKKLGSNLLFYLLSIALLFIFIRVLLEKFNISPTIREGLIDSKEIGEISKQKRFTLRNDNDDGEITSDNIFKAGNDLIMEHLDNAVKYKNKNNSKDMKHISELKKSAYSKNNNRLKKGFDNIKDDCTDKNELYKKRKKEFTKIGLVDFKENSKKLSKDFFEWWTPMRTKLGAVRNRNETEQLASLNLYIGDTGLDKKFHTDICKMFIEEPDTIKGNVSTKQNMKKFLERSFENGNKIFNDIKKHTYFKDVKEDYKRYKQQEKQEKKQKKQEKEEKKQKK